MPRIVSTDTPFVRSRSHSRDCGRSSTPPVNMVMFTASDFADVPFVDQVAQVADRRIAAGLQAHHGAHALRRAASAIASASARFAPSGHSQ